MKQISKKKQISCSLMCICTAAIVRLWQINKYFLSSRDKRRWTDGHTNRQIILLLLNKCCRHFMSYYLMKCFVFGTFLIFFVGKKKSANSRKKNSFKWSRIPLICALANDIFIWKLEKNPLPFGKAKHCLEFSVFALLFIQMNHLKHIIDNYAW